MKRKLACLVLVTGGLTACSGEEALHSSPPCPDGQHQECKGDDNSVLCECVGDTAEGGSGGADAHDAAAE